LGNSNGFQAIYLAEVSPDDTAFSAEFRQRYGYNVLRTLAIVKDIGCIRLKLISTVTIAEIDRNELHVAACQFGAGSLALESASCWICVCQIYDRVECSWRANAEVFADDFR
jgi:hypothetical protein